MSRLLVSLAALLALVALAAAAVGVLAYGTGADRDGTLEVGGLDAPVELVWDEAGRVWVEGPDEAALAAGLGYAHAADHGWSAALWRQAARGELAEWFGEDARALDLHARTLGFAGLARRTYNALGDDDRAILDAYARGASAGFAQPGVAQGDAFIVADVVPQAWAPWDPLAVERLHAYLSTPAPSADSTWRRAARADSAVAAFLEADAAFRAFLGVPGGGGADRAYTLSADTSGADRVLVQQLASGSSALATLAPAVLRTPDRTALALTIPGSLVSPGGYADGTGWALLLGSDLRLEPYGGPKPPPVFSRIVGRGGDETLLEVARDTAGLVLRAGADSSTPTASDTTAAFADTTAAPADTTAATLAGTGWRVRWQGFQLGTDLGAFRALRDGRRPGRFVLFDGAGLTSTRAEAAVLGSPRVAIQAGGETLVAQDTLAQYARSILTAADTTAADSVGGLRAIVPSDREVTSGWARDLLPDLVAALGPRDSLADVLQAPYAYLNGWDGAYRADGIAPSLFEWWLVSHRELTGHLPDLSDSLDVRLLPSSLRIARAELRDRYGPLPTGWRWGRLQGGPSYPVLGRYSSAAARTFRDPLGPPGGHPTTLLPGPSLVFDDALAGLAVWTVRTDLATGQMRVASPTLRPPAVGALDIDAGPTGDALTLDPSAPMPDARLRLEPLAL